MALDRIAVAACQRVPFAAHAAAAWIIATGAERQTLPTCGDADDVFFDARRARIYVSCGAGEMAVLERSSAGWRALDLMRTASGARTSLFVPDLDRLFVAERAGLIGSEAAIARISAGPMMRGSAGQRVSASARNGRLMSMR